MCWTWNILIQAEGQAVNELALKVSPPPANFVLSAVAELPKRSADTENRCPSLWSIWPVCLKRQWLHLRPKLRSQWTRLGCGGWGGVGAGRKYANQTHLPALSTLVFGQESYFYCLHIFEDISFTRCKCKTGLLWEFGRSLGSWGKLCHRKRGSLFPGGTGRGSPPFYQETEPSPTPMCSAKSGIISSLASRTLWESHSSPLSQNSNLASAGRYPRCGITCPASGHPAWVRVCSRRPPLLS